MLLFAIGQRIYRPLMIFFKRGAIGTCRQQCAIVVILNLMARVPYRFWMSGRDTGNLGSAAHIVHPLPVGTAAAVAAAVAMLSSFLRMHLMLQQ